MATSAAYNFAPPIGSLALAAYRRCQIARTSLSAEHMEDAYLETNLMQADWSADGITFWTVTLVMQPLAPGVTTYTVPANAVTVLDVYINNGTSNRLLFPLSRTDYASIAVPNQQGFPTSYWHNRVIPSTLTLWPTPDAANNYIMNYYIYQQIQDANISGGGNINMPYFWLDAYVADLAHRLSRIHAPQLEPVRMADRDRAYGHACKQSEIVPVYITPNLAGFYRS